MNPPLVSVIICVYNAEKYLKDAINSFLAQDYAHKELIVVDDASTDNSPKIASSFPEIQLVSFSKNIGLPRSRNIGIEATSGEYIAFLDADDLWVRDRLSRQVQFHLEHPDFKYSYSQERFFYENGIEAPNWTKKRVFQSDHMSYHLGGMLIHRSLFDLVGDFNPEFTGHNDSADWIFRAKDQGFIGGEINEVFLHRRIHGENLSSAISMQNKYLLKAIKSSIERQKKDDG